MSQLFWYPYWANLLASLSVIVILGLVGFVAKHRITKNLKKFISSEVDEVVKKVTNDKKN
jgi:hypothetical protein